VPSLKDVYNSSENVNKNIEDNIKKMMENLKKMVNKEEEDLRRDQILRDKYKSGK